MQIKKIREGGLTQEKLEKIQPIVDNIKNADTRLAIQVDIDDEARLKELVFGF